MSVTFMIYTPPLILQFTNTRITYFTCAYLNYLVVGKNLNLLIKLFYYTVTHLSSPIGPDLNKTYDNRGK